MKGCFIGKNGVDQSQNDNSLEKFFQNSRSWSKIKFGNTNNFLYSGGWDCAWKIVKQEGVVGLFQGFSVNIFRGIGGTLLLVGYDYIKLFLHSQ